MGRADVRWRLGTAALVAACIGLAGWVAVRDWAKTSNDGMLRASTAMQGLFPGVDSALLGQVGPTAWLVRVTGRQRTRCFVIDTDRVRRDAGGVYGVRPAPCR